MGRLLRGTSCRSLVQAVLEQFFSHRQAGGEPLAVLGGEPVAVLGGHRLGCHSASSPPAGVVITERQPVGPSRGSSVTGAPTSAVSASISAAPRTAPSSVSGRAAV